MVWALVRYLQLVKLVRYLLLVRGRSTWILPRASCAYLIYPLIRGTRRLIRDTRRSIRDTRRSIHDTRRPSVPNWPVEYRELTGEYRELTGEGPELTERGVRMHKVQEDKVCVECYIFSSLPPPTPPPSEHIWCGKETNLLQYCSQYNNCMSSDENGGRGWKQLAPWYHEGSSTPLCFGV